MPHRKSIALTSLLFSLIHSNLTQAEPKTAGIVAQASVLTGQNQSTLAFTLINNTEQNLKTIPLGTKWNRLEVTSPKEKKEEIWVPVDNVDEINVKPSESYTWKVSTTNKIGLYKVFSEKGLCRVKWKVKGANFEEVVSNEILVLNEGNN